MRGWFAPVADLLLWQRLDGETMKRLVFVFVAFLFAAFGAVADAPPKYFVDESKLPFAALPGLPAQQLWGVHNGAAYRVEVPSNWNGKLVMWAHGFRGT